MLCKGKGKNLNECTTLRCHMYKMTEMTNDSPHHMLMSVQRGIGCTASGTIDALPHACTHTHTYVHTHAHTHTSRKQFGIYTLSTVAVACNYSNWETRTRRWQVRGQLKSFMSRFGSNKQDGVICGCPSESNKEPRGAEKVSMALCIL